MIKRSKIIPSFNPVFLEVLDIFGISRNQLIKVKKRQCIFCNVVHTITPLSFENYFAEIGMRIKQLFFKIFNLNQYVPHLYCFCNRNKPLLRVVLNFDEILHFTQQFYPNISFIEIRDRYGTIKENAIHFAQIKFLFAPTGSNLVKTYFMQNESVIVSIGTCDFFWRYDNSVIINSIYTRVFILQFISPIKHYSEGGTVSVDLCLKYIQKGIYCTINHHWPPLENITS